MKKYQYQAVLLAMTVFLAACSVDERNSSVYENKIDSINNNKKIDKLLVLPSQGCGGCITNAEDFLNNNYKSFQRDNIYIIITGHKSSKSAIIRLGGYLKKMNNLFIDTLGFFDKEDFINQYPRVYNLKKRKIETYIDISPENKIDISTLIFNY